MAIIFIYLFAGRLQAAFSNLGNENYKEVLFLVFIIVLIVAAVLSFIKSYSLIPILGALCCLYLMISIPPKSWMVFFAWMALGLLIYFMYGNRKSRLRS
ncbi:MAG TPA: amino acid permease C-terminal domain-containing protein [Arachidicoccus sp.]